MIYDKMVTKVTLLDGQETKKSNICRHNPLGERFYEKIVTKMMLLDRQKQKSHTFAAMIRLISGSMINWMAKLVLPAGITIV